MKLSPHLADIERAFVALLQSLHTVESDNRAPPAYYGRRIRSDLPRDRPTVSVPRIIDMYPTSADPPPTVN
jgi:hypothetical protein